MCHPARPELRRQARIRTHAPTGVPDGGTDGAHTLRHDTCLPQHHFRTGDRLCRLLPSVPRYRCAGMGDVPGKPLRYALRTGRGGHHHQRTGMDGHLRRDARPTGGEAEERIPLRETEDWRHRLLQGARPHQAHTPGVQQGADRVARGCQRWLHARKCHEPTGSPGTVRHPLHRAAHTPAPVAQDGCPVP